MQQEGENQTNKIQASEQVSSGSGIRITWARIPSVTFHSKILEKVAWIPEPSFPQLKTDIIPPISYRSVV